MLLLIVFYHMIVSKAWNTCSSMDLNQFTGLAKLLHQQADMYPNSIFIN